MRLQLKEIDGEMYLHIPIDLVEEFALESGDRLEIDFPDEDMMSIYFPS